MRDLSSAPTFLVETPEDAATLRNLGADVVVMGEGPGMAPNAIVITRGDGRELLRGMNLAATGRFLDIEPGTSLAEFLCSREHDPLGCLDELARDVFWSEERPLSEWSAPEQQQGRPCGFEFLEHHLRWTSPELVVLAGPYGCGKSSFTRLLAYRWADTIGRQDGHRVSIVGWEDKVQTVKREVERYALGGDEKGGLNSAQSKRVFDMQGRVGWTQRHPDDARLLSWYCELVEHRAKRDGVRFFVFDPFNEHDSTRGRNQTETDYVREMMMQFRKLVHGLGIILIVVTHVSAKSYDEAGGIKPFRIANASGSVQFGNKADRGICILRTKQLARVSTLGASEHWVLNFDKATDEETMGARGTVACVFDARTMTITKDGGATEKAQEQWS
jgi:hypothetical protein